MLTTTPLRIARGLIAITGIFLTLETTSAADLSDLLSKCAPNIDLTTIGALVQHESGGNPYAILDNGNWRLPKNKRVLRSFRPQSQTEAVETAKQLIATGHVIDMGLGQINNRNLKSLGITVEQIFDPCTNLQAAQTILSNNYVMAMKRYGTGNQALYAALSAYNTGNFIDGFANGYVQEVLRASVINVPALQAIPASFGQSRLAVLAGGETREKAQHTRGKSRKSQLLEAKLATIEVEIF